MGYATGKSEGGSGGGRGHSGMDHASKTEEVKDAARVARRSDDKKEILHETMAGWNERFRPRSVVRAGLGHRTIDVAPVVETELRAREVRLLINVIEPDPEVQAFLVTDEASALDVSANSAETVRRRLEGYLKRPLPLDLQTPLWRLVDAIKREIPGWPDFGLPEPD
jgi:hypothetical protein